MRSVLLIVAVLSAGLAAGSVRADRPTSGDMSILSGRTLGNGESAASVAAGWPGIWGQLTLAPSSTVNIGLEVGLLYGAPVMALDPGFGAYFSAPMRFHLFGEGSFDLALRVEPMLAIGQGAIAGQTGIFSNNLGITGGGAVGAVAGYQLSEAVTLGFGAGIEVWALAVVDADVNVAGIGVGMFALEALISRDTMLFGQVELGGGIRPNTRFRTPAVVRVSLGLTYLL